MQAKIDLTPAVLDLVLYSGDGEEFEVSFVNADNVAFDVSAFTWTSQIRKTRTAEDAIDLDIDVSQANVGILIVTISAAITRALPRRSQWDLQCTSVDKPDPRTFLQGSVSCIQDVTRT